MTALITVLVVFSITLSSAQAESLLWQSKNNHLWAQNCDFDGNIIQAVQSLEGNCGRLCFEDPECTRFTWTNRDGGICQFRSGNGIAFIVQNGGICGVVSAKVKTASIGIVWTLSHSQNVRWAHGCDFDGSIIKESTDELENCKNECEAQDECFGFTYIESSRNCRLRSRGEATKLYIRTDVCGEKINPKTSSQARNQDQMIGGAQELQQFLSKKIPAFRVAEEACNNYKRNVSAMTNINQIDHRIYNGRLARENEFPWMAALFYREENGKHRVLCGGTIISDYYILTAAHCLKGTKENEWYNISFVRLGTRFWNDSESQTISVEVPTVHENYNSYSYKNDIALIKLTNPITFSPRVYPACLRVDVNDLPSSQEIFASGWGKTTELNGNGPISPILKTTSGLETVELERCQTIYRRLGSEPRFRIIETQYCAAVPRNGTLSDAREGDSGGPLQMFDDTQVATVVGIVSAGPDGSKRYPGIYTRVASYVNWIVDKVWNN